MFFATGRSPAQPGLGLDRAGVAVKPMGAVIVDDEFRTSQPHIYAIGDVTDRLNLTPVATAEGHASPKRYSAIARAVFRSRTCRRRFSPRRRSRQCGLTEEKAALQGPVDIYVTQFTPMRHALTGRTRKTLMKLVVGQRSQKVLGAHMLGEDAPEIMQGVGDRGGLRRDQGGFRPHHRNPPDSRRGVRHHADPHTGRGRGQGGGVIAGDWLVRFLPTRYSESMGIRPDAQAHVPTSVVLERLLDDAPADRVTLEWLLASLRERSFGIVMLFWDSLALLLECQRSRAWCSRFWRSR